MKYICISKNEDRALYYLKNLNRQRIYRGSYPIPKEKDFKIFEYKNKNMAQTLCDEINKAYNDNFIVKEVEE